MPNGYINILPRWQLIFRCLTRPRCLGARLEVFLREWMEMLFCPLREVHGPDRFILHRNRHEKVPHIPRFCTSAVTDQIQSLGATWSTSLVFSGHHQVTIRCCTRPLSWSGTPPTASGRRFTRWSILERTLSPYRFHCTVAKYNCCICDPKELYTFQTD